MRMPRRHEVPATEHTMNTEYLVFSVDPVANLSGVVAGS